MRTATHGVSYQLVAINWMFDQVLSRLYGLTEEEIAIVERPRKGAAA